MAAFLRIFMMISLAAGIVIPAVAQELNCVVEINTDNIEGTGRSVFESLKQTVSDYMNETKFSDAVFAENEKIDCRLYLTVMEYSGTRIKGELQMQLSRPVYNTNYTTSLLNYRDTKVEFDYREGEPLVFNRTSENSNLEALLNFYAYLFLGMDFDSFSPRGGDAFYEQAKSVVNRAQSAGEPGWRMFEDNRNRASLLGAFTEPSNAGIRDILYKYHRKGLDEMATGVDKGRSEISASLDILKGIASSNPMSFVIPLFGDMKLDELVNVYSKAPESERMKVYSLLQEIYPTENERLEKIKNPE